MQMCLNTSYVFQEWNFSHPWKKHPQSWTLVCICHFVILPVHATHKAWMTLTWCYRFIPTNQSIWVWYLRPHDLVVPNQQHTTSRVEIKEVICPQIQDFTCIPRVRLRIFSQKLICKYGMWSYPYANRCAKSLICEFGLEVVVSL